VARKDFVARVAARVAAARRAHGLTQEALAEEIGTSTRALQRLESGKQNCTIRMIARVAKALEMEPEALIAGSKE